LKALELHPALFLSKKELVACSTDHFLKFQKQQKALFYGSLAKSG
jgi:hypothetical protein